MLSTWVEKDTYDEVLKILDGSDTVDEFLAHLLKYRNKVEDVMKEGREDMRNVDDIMEDIPLMEDYETDKSFYENPVDQMIEYVFQPVLEQVKEDS